MIATKVLQSGFFWPTLFRYAHRFRLAYERYQRVVALSRCDMMPLSPILIVKIFDVLDIDFIGYFPPSFGFVYKLVAIDYVSKWAEALATRMNDYKFVKRITFYQYETPSALISHGSSHVYPRLFDTLLQKYYVTHKVATPYHQVEVYNREISP